MIRNEHEGARSMMMAIALALAAQASAAAAGDAGAMHAAAARCGLPADWLRFGHDEDGDYADPATARRAVGIAPEAIVCITAWAQSAHARFAFYSEPPPGPRTLAILPAAAITDAVFGAERCGLPIRIDPLDQSRSMMLARRHAPPTQLVCLRAWLTAHGVAPTQAR